MYYNLTIKINSFLPIKTGGIGNRGKKEDNRSIGWGNYG